MRAASVTAGELGWDAIWTDSFDGSGHDRTPTIPSHEFPGVVAALGDGATGWQEGDEAYGLAPFTCNGAVAVPLAALTAWQTLVDHAHVRPGQRVLMHGGAGGVGSFTVQIASALGAAVTATMGPNDLAFVRSLGANTAIDYVYQRFEDEIDPVDIVVDLAGAQTTARSWSSSTTEPHSAGGLVCAALEALPAQRRTCESPACVTQVDPRMERPQTVGDVSSSVTGASCPRGASGGVQRATC